MSEMAGPPLTASSRLVSLDAQGGLITMLMAIDRASYFMA